MQIEELTEQMERAVKLSQDAEAAKQNDSTATMPELPPAHAIASGKTVDEVWQDLNKSPLFMTDLEDNDDVAALQALAYEGTPLENGLDFKERGNECFKAQMHADAKEFYGKGILILAAEERKRAHGEKTVNPLTNEEDGEDEIKRQREALETLYVNRAACHLALKNYRSCWTDCAAALRLNPANLKACYRSARALLAVDRIAEADDICARGLSLDSNNAPLRSVADSIVARAKQLDAVKRRDAERLAKEKRRGLLVKAALKARNIPTRTTSQPPEMEDACIRLTPDPDSPQSSLEFPTVLLYPCDLESDFIKGFGETQTLGDHLAYILPLPWDHRGRYSADGVEAYVETREGGLLKMGRKVSLLKVLSSGKVEVVDEVVRIFVVPKGEAVSWVAEHKAKRAAEKGEVVS